MYLPYLTSRWDKLAMITSYDELKKVFHKGYLVFVKKGDERIAGNLIYHGYDTPVLTVNCPTTFSIPFALDFTNV